MLFRTRHNKIFQNVNFTWKRAAFIRKVCGWKKSLSSARQNTKSTKFWRSSSKRCRWTCSAIWSNQIKQSTSKCATTRRRLKCCPISVNNSWSLPIPRRVRLCCIARQAVWPLNALSPNFHCTLLLLLLYRVCVCRSSNYHLSVVFFNAVFAFQTCFILFLFFVHSSYSKPKKKNRY